MTLSRPPGARPLIGIALIMAAAACFASLDTTVRHTGRLVPLLLMLMCRYGFQALTMGAWLAFSRRRPGGAGFRAAHPRFQALRGALLLASSAFAFLALQHMPVAEFTAIAMLTPVLVTLLAAWLLREKVSVLRWLLVGGAFVGTVIVMRPGSNLFGWAVLLPLASAASYALFQLLTSKLAHLEHPLTTHFYTGLVGSVLVLPVLWLSPVDVTVVLAQAAPATLGALVLVGLFGTVGHLLLILGLGRAPTSTLMPFLYLQIAMAALLGWVFFGDLPDAWGWLGMAVIAVCGAASAWLNLRSPATQDVLAVAPEED